jgi:hypothetical protein
MNDLNGAFWLSELNRSKISRRCVLWRINTEGISASRNAFLTGSTSDSGRQFGEQRRTKDKIVPVSVPVQAVPAPAPCLNTLVKQGFGAGEGNRTLVSSCSDLG